LQWPPLVVPPAPAVLILLRLLQLQRQGSSRHVSTESMLSQVTIFVLLFSSTWFFMLIQPHNVLFQVRCSLLSAHFCCCCSLRVTGYCRNRAAVHPLRAVPGRLAEPVHLPRHRHHLLLHGSPPTALHRRQRARQDLPGHRRPGVRPARPPRRGHVHVPRALPRRR
jgi:hypothetical protein